MDGADVSVLDGTSTSATQVFSFMGIDIPQERFIEEMGKSPADRDDTELFSGPMFSGYESPKIVHVGLQAAYDKPVEELSEGFTLGVHSLTVVHAFNTSFQTNPLFNAREVPVGTRVSGTDEEVITEERPAFISQGEFRIFLALHDCLKNDSIKAMRLSEASGKVPNKKGRELKFVQEGIQAYFENLFTNNGSRELSEEDQNKIRFFKALIQVDSIGTLLKGEESLEEITKDLKAAYLPISDLITEEDFFDYMAMFYQCDAGAYGSLRSVLFESGTFILNAENTERVSDLKSHFCISLKTDRVLELRDSTGVYARSLYDERIILEEANRFQGIYNKPV
ncbi:hypothetical protein DID80_07615, partial [Candidatus Marinamargulisbacteria bacterium SCGC AAA071-K20]